MKNKSVTENPAEIEEVDFSGVSWIVARQGLHFNNLLDFLLKEHRYIRFYDSAGSGSHSLGQRDILDFISKLTEDKQHLLSEFLCKAFDWLVDCNEEYVKCFEIVRRRLADDIQVNTMFYNGINFEYKYMYKNDLGLDFLIVLYYLSLILSTEKGVTLAICYIGTYLNRHLENWLVKTINRLATVRGVNIIFIDRNHSVYFKNEYPFNEYLFNDYGLFKLLNNLTNTDKFYTMNEYESYTNLEADAIYNKTGVILPKQLEYISKRAI